MGNAVSTLFDRILDMRANARVHHELTEKQSKAPRLRNESLRDFNYNRLEGLDGSFLENDTQIQRPEVDNTQDNVTPQRKERSGRWKTKSESSSGERGETNTIALHERAILTVNQFYPHFKEAMQSEGEMICIPACHDVMPGALHEVNESMNRYKGDLAEERFRAQFRRLHLGGLYISGFQAHQFMAAMKSKTGKSKHNKLPNFEVDGLFIHGRHGIYIIEIKSTDDHQHQYENSLKKAKEQLQNAERGIKEIYVNYMKLVGEETDIDFPIRKAICFPFGELSDFDTVHSEDRTDYTIINKSSMASEEDFKHIWMEKISDDNNVDEKKLDRICKFAKAIGGYRSTVFVSTTYCALEIGRIIATQNFSKTYKQSNKERKTWDCFESPTNIFLKNDQLQALECKKKCVLVTGKPGAGKTLIVLMRALEALKNKSNGRVLIHSESEHLIAKFEQFFDTNKSSDWQRDPVFVSGALNDRPEDDVFSDETKSFVSHFQRRQNGSGETTVSITGFHHPASVKGMDDIIKEKLSGYECFRLETVIRGTSAVASAWHEKSHYQAGCPLSMGHNISGLPVDKIKIKNQRQLLDEIYRKLNELLSLTNPIDAEFLPRHIAVITDYDTTSELVKGFLREKGIACGSVEEQVWNPQLVAVESSLHTMSYEWPFVIVAARYCINIDVSFFLRSASRCIAHLIIIERDYMAVQANLDDILQNLDISQLDFNQFKELVKEARAGEYDDDTLELDTALAVFHSDYLSLSVRSWPECTNCERFSDFMAQMGQDKFLCTVLLSIKEVKGRIQRMGAALESRTYITPPLFKTLFETQKDPDRYEKYMELFYGLHKTSQIHLFWRIFYTWNPLKWSLAWRLKNDDFLNWVANCFIFRYLVPS